MAAKLTGGREATGDVIAFIDCHCAPQANWYQERCRCSTACV